MQWNLMAGIGGLLLGASLAAQTGPGGTDIQTPVTANQHRDVLVTFHCARFAPGRGAVSGERRTVEAFLAAMDGPDRILGKPYCEGYIPDQHNCGLPVTGPHRYRERQVRFEFRMVGDCGTFSTRAAPKAPVGTRGGSRVITVDDHGTVGTVYWGLNANPRSGGQRLSLRTYFYYSAGDPAGPPPERIRYQQP